jgi:hypothetical protein
MSLLFAFAVLLAAPQGDADDPLKDVVPVVGMTYCNREKAGSSPANERSTCYCLIGDYGFLIKWDDKVPPEFYIYEKKPPRLDCLSSFDELVQWIKRTPEEAKVTWIKSCAGTDWNMPQDKRDQLEQVWGPKKTSDKKVISDGYCTCETHSVVIFKSLEEGRKWIRGHEHCIDAFWGKPFARAGTK